MKKKRSRIWLLVVAISGACHDTPSWGQGPAFLPSPQISYVDPSAKSNTNPYYANNCPPMSQAGVPRALPGELQTTNGIYPNPQRPILAHPIPPALEALEQNRRGVYPSGQGLPYRLESGYGSAAGTAGDGNTGGYPSFLDGMSGTGANAGMAGAGGQSAFGNGAEAAGDGYTGPGGEAGTGASEMGFGEAGSGSRGAGGGGGGRFDDLVILGDQNPYFLRSAARSPNGGPPPTPGALGAPLIRQAFKMADNQTPVPVTRFYYSFNYFNDVNAAYNLRANANFEAVQLYHNTFGYEQAFARDDHGVQRASLGVRMPWDVMTFRDQYGAARQGNSIGDVSLYGKYLFWYDPDSYNLVSGGLMVTTPTGPKTFANAERYIVNQTVAIQPFVGYRYQLGERSYMQGFSAIEAPANNQGPTIMYNDFQINYFAYKSQQPSGWLRAIVPVYELHVNTPLTHRGYSEIDQFFATDVVSMTWGTHVMLGDNVTFSTGVGVPVTGVHPYSYEVLCLLNVTFGGGRRDRLPTMPLTPNF